MITNSLTSFSTSESYSTNSNSNSFDTESNDNRIPKIYEKYNTLIDLFQRQVSALKVEHDQIVLPTMEGKSVEDLTQLIQENKQNLTLAENNQKEIRDEMISFLKASRYEEITDNTKLKESVQRISHLRSQILNFENELKEKSLLKQAFQTAFEKKNDLYIKMGYIQNTGLPILFQARDKELSQLKHSSTNNNTNTIEISSNNSKITNISKNASTVALNSDTVNNNSMSINGNNASPSPKTRSPVQFIHIPHLQNQTPIISIPAILLPCRNPNDHFKSMNNQNTKNDPINNNSNSYNNNNNNNNNFNTENKSYNATMNDSSKNSISSNELNGMRNINTLKRSNSCLTPVKNPSLHPTSHYQYNGITWNFSPFSSEIYSRHLLTPSPNTPTKTIRLPMEEAVALMEKNKRQKSSSK